MSENRKKVLKDADLRLQIPEALTQAGFAFLAEYLRQQEFRLFISNLQHFVQGNPQFVVEYHQRRKSASPVMAALEEGQTEDDIQELIYRGYFLEPHQRVVDEMLYCKIIDNWLAYISEVLALIYTARPEALKSSEQVRLDYILQFKDTETLVAALAERKVEKLAFLGIKDLADFFYKELSFTLVEDGEKFDYLIESVEIRNIIVHARGYVSKILKTRLPHYSGKIGEPVALGDTYLLGNKLFTIAMDIDKRAAKKWNISCVPTKAF